METTAERKKNRSGAFYLWVGMLIPALIMLLGFVVVGVWPFGDGTILKVDSLHQYLPFFTDFHEKLRSGDSLFYSFTGGLGYDFWATYAYYLASPFNLLIVLVPKANVCDFMDLMILLKVAACGGIFSWYLHKREPSARYMPLVFGAMYAMCNFFVGYSFNLMWLDSIAMVPLIMYGIERLIKGKGGWVYGLSLFYALWCNYYIGFMLCIFSCLYLLVCLVCVEKPERIIRRCLLFGWYSLLAGGMAAVVLLPAYRSLTASESMLSNSFPSRLKFYTDFLSMYLSHFITAKPINISDSQVGFNAYCGTIVPALAFLYLLDGRIRLRERLAHFLLTALLFASVTVNYLNYMWHGFHTQNGLPNRFAFLYVLMALLLSYDVFAHIEDPSGGVRSARAIDNTKNGVNGGKLLIAGGIALGFTVLTLLRADMGDNWIGGIYRYMTPMLLTVYMLLLLILLLLHARKEVIAFSVGSIMLVEAVGHGIFGMCENGSVTRSIYLKDQASYQTMMTEQGDTDFFRSEIDSQRMRNVTMFAGGYSMVLFNSTMSEAVTDFCHHLGIEARTNKNGYNGVTRLMNDVFGIRYVLASIGRGNHLYQFPEIADDGNLTLYKNDDALSLGFVVKEDIRDWDIYEGTPIGVQNQFVRLATGIEDLYVLDRSVEAADNEKVEVKVPENKQVYLYLPEKIEKFRLNTPEYHRDYTTYTDHLYTMNSLGDENIGDFTCELKSSQSEVRVNIYTCPDAVYKQVRDALAQSQLENVQVGHARISAALEAKQSGILLLTIPYDTDWKVLLDGQPVQTEPIGEALTGVAVTEGSHTLSMRFVPAGFYLGLALSLACLVLMGGTVVLDRRKFSHHDRRDESRVWPEYRPRRLRETFADDIGEDFANESASGITTDIKNEISDEMADGIVGDNDDVITNDTDDREVTDMENTPSLWKEEAFLARLREIAGAEQVLVDEPMSTHTTFRIGGPADVLVAPASTESLVKVMDLLRQEKIPFYIIGNGSNLLVGDGGFRGVIVQVYKNLSAIEVDGETFTASAGAMLSAVARAAYNDGLTGLEFASGIPGTVGGAVVMNAGAYGGEMKDVLTSVRVLTPQGEIMDIPAAEMGFGYRTSIVSDMDYIVLEASFRLRSGEKESILETMNSLKEQRVSKQPLDKPSAGSAFKRPEGYFAGKLIMDAGLKGYSVGGACVSEKHAGFVVNNGGATARDVMELINDVKEKVLADSGVELECEVRMIGEFV